MSTLVVIKYDDRYKAEDMRLKLRRMEKDYLIDLKDAVSRQFQWGYRDNKGGWHVPDYRIQFSPDTTSRSELADRKASNSILYSAFTKLF